MMEDIVLNLEIFVLKHLEGSVFYYLRRFIILSTMEFFLILQKRTQFNAFLLVSFGKSNIRSLFRALINGVARGTKHKTVLDICMAYCALREARLCTSSSYDIACYYGSAFKWCNSALEEQYSEPVIFRLFGVICFEIANQITNKNTWDGCREYFKKILTDDQLIKDKSIEFSYLNIMVCNIGRVIPNTEDSYYSAILDYSLAILSRNKVDTKRPCFLCYKIGKLEHSHIWPNSVLHRVASGSKLTDGRVYRDGVDVTKSYRSKEIKWPMLCKGCEQIMVIGENYFLDNVWSVFYGPSSQFEKNVDTVDLGRSVTLQNRESKMQFYTISLAFRHLINVTSPRLFTSNSNIRKAMIVWRQHLLRRTGEQMPLPTYFLTLPHQIDGLNRYSRLTCHTFIIEGAIVSKVFMFVFIAAYGTVTAKLPNITDGDIIIGSNQERLNNIPEELREEFGQCNLQIAFNSHFANTSRRKRLLKSITESPKNSIDRKRYGLNDALVSDTGVNLENISQCFIDRQVEVITELPDSIEFNLDNIVAEVPKIQCFSISKFCCEARCVYKFTSWFTGVESLELPMYTEVYLAPGPTWLFFCVLSLDTWTKVLFGVQYRNGVFSTVRGVEDQVWLTKCFTDHFLELLQITTEFINEKAKEVNQN